jgi:hypothetical protein
MTSCRMQFAVALAVAVAGCLLLSACHRDKGGAGGGQAAVHNVTLSVDASGNCVQTDGTQVAPLIDLSAGDSVSFQNSSFTVQFPQPSPGSCTSPFKDNAGNCKTSFSNTNPNTGPANTSSGTYRYSAMSINGQSCTLPSGGANPMGMRMR